MLLCYYATDLGSFAVFLVVTLSWLHVMAFVVLDDSI